MNDFHDDEHIRALLDEAVSDVEPRDALGSIHARTKVSSMNRKRSWFLGAGAAVVATAATVAAVTVLSGDGTTGGPSRDIAGAASSPTAGTSEDAQPMSTEVPTDRPATPQPTSATDSPAPEVAAVPVYYVGELRPLGLTGRGPRLYREFHRLNTVGDPLQAAVREAVATPPEDPDYRTDWPAGTAVDTGFDGVGNDGQISIELYNESTDLRERPAGMTAEEASMAVEQLIYTAQAATQTRAPVQFYLARKGSSQNRTDTILGVPVSEPLAQGDPADVLAQVWIIEPAEGVKVQSPFTVTGLAAAYEANVQWALLQGNAIIRSGYTTAKECCTMAPYSFEVHAPPGEYTLRVNDTDPSDGEGLPPWEDTKQVIIVP